MGFWQVIKDGYKKGAKKAHVEAETTRFINLSKVIKVIEPNHDRIVTVEITTAEQYRHLYVSQLTTYAEAIKCKVSVSGNKVTIETPDFNTAEIIRTVWAQP